MSAILALETSGAVCSVCLDVDGNRFELTHHVDRRHNELLLGMVDDVCERAGLARENLTAAAFGCGPGSFTGVRIAAACVQAISLALNIPVVPVPSSIVLVNAGVRLGLLPVTGDMAAHVLPQQVVTSIRSRAELYYMAGYTLAGSRMEAIRTDELHGSLETVPSEIAAGSLLLGARPQWWTGADWLAVSPTAVDVLESAEGALLQGQGVASALALPVYVSGDTPWRRQGKK